MSKTWVALLALALIGCGGGAATPAEALQGTWVDAGDGTTCAKGITFEGDQFSFQVLCGSGTSFTDDIEGGTFSATGSVVSVTMTKSSCPASADRSLNVSYSLSGATLTISDASGFSSFMRDSSSPGGNADVQFGCIASDGTFTPMPISSL